MTDLVKVFIIILKKLNLCDAWFQLEFQWVTMLTILKYITTCSIFLVVCKSNEIPKKNF